MSDAVFLYVTSKDDDEATAIARELVQNRLVACANILSPMQSFYWWEGAVQNDRETVLILKTRSELVEPIVRRIKELHSYTCPCVVALPIVAGNPDFLSWLQQETAR